MDCPQLGVKVGNLEFMRTRYRPLYNPPLGIPFAEYKSTVQHLVVAVKKT